MGGSICNADPAADYPAALLSLEAFITTNSRIIKAEDFFIDMFETILETEEIVISISFPIKNKSYYLKYASQASKYAIIGIFTCLSNEKYNVAITGASNKVFLLEEIRSLPVSKLKNYNFKSIDLSAFNINNDINASATYRESLIKNLISKTIRF